MSPSWFGRRGRGTGDQEPWKERRSFFYSIRQFLHRYRFVGVGILLLIFLIVVGIVVFQLIPADRLTPVVVVQSAPYRWPLPPNAWAAEDVRDLSEMDGQTLTIVTGSGPVQTASDVAKIVDRDSPLVQDILKRQTRPIILYVSMHGVIEDGVPCLIPPAGSMSDPESWTKLPDLINGFHGKFSEVHLLVVLDCSRVRSNWHMGRSYNDFSNGLDAWWQQARGDYEKVAILCSNHPGQRGWTSAALRGSVFGHFFRLGLAGAADDHPAADNDGDVSLVELKRYLDDRVSQWVRHHRADEQQPLLLVSGEDSNDFVVANSLNQRQLQRLVDRDAAIIPETPAAALDSLWRDVDRLRESQPYCFEPLAWRDVEHQLLWLDLLANAGPAYAPLAQRNDAMLRLRLDEIMARKSTADLTRSVRDDNAIISGTELSLPYDLHVHSVPLAEYLGTMEAELPGTLLATVAEFGDSPSSRALDQTLARMERLGARDLTDQHFLRMLNRYQFPGMWQQAPRLRQLLQIRQQSEQLGVPDLRNSDERTHYWVRQRLSDADELRRRTEDALFVAGQPSLETQLEQAATAYQSVQADAMDLSTAIRIRDKAWAELPYLAQWLNDPLRDGRDAQTLRDVLIPLIEDNKALEQRIDNHDALASGPAAVIADISEIKTQGQVVGEKLDQLNRQLIDECDRLVNSNISGNGAADLRLIEAALRCPLITADRRGALLDRYGDIETRLINSTPSGESPSSSDVESASPSDLAASSGGWAQSPGHGVPLLLLSDEPSGAEAAEWHQGVQDLLGHIESLSERYAQVGQQEELDDREVRSEWVAAERRLRRVASIWFLSPDMEDPVSELRRIDARALVLWHGTRSLDDFWGVAGQTVDVRPFFDVATNSYLESTRRMLTTYGSRDIASLQARLTTSRLAALSWMKTSATASVLLQSDDNIKTRVTVRPEAPSPELPTGTAALMTRQNGKRLADADFGTSASVPVPSGSASDMILRDRLAGADRTGLQVEAMFRGHEFQSPLTVDLLQGVTVAHQPHAYGEARVTVHSPWNKLSVVFVLDCSGSMETRVAPDRERLFMARNALAQTQFEAALQDEITQDILEQTLFDLNKTRLDVAREALQIMLSNLEGRRNVRVGVRFFGHRLGWSTDRPVRMMTSPSYPRNLPNGLTPELDVERILPLSDFNPALARRVYRELDGVTAWGQTPLHLSLQRALSEDFGREDIDADQHLIVLTDGRNYQFRPSSDGRTSIREIVDLAQQRRVPVHILGLDMDPEEWSDAEADFAQLANRTDGVYENLTSSTDLIEALRTIFAPESCRLENGDGQLVDEGPLGLPLVAPSGDVGPYAVRFRDGREAILLEGGEALSFFGRPRGSQLDFPRFDHDLARSASLVQASRRGSPNHVVQFHRPMRLDRGVQFPVSIQRREQRAWQWTRRPVEAWIEITPVGSTWPTYIFYDANYEPHQPVPVVHLVATDWPKDVDQAAIQVWFSPRASQPQTVASLSSVVGAPPVEQANVTPGVSLRLDAGRVASDRYRVRVVEIHDEGSAGVGSLKVLPPLGRDVRPTEIVRQFDKQRRHAVHSFYYAEPDDALLARLARAEIGVVRREPAHRNAWRLPVESVVVDISESGNFLPLATR